MEPFDSTNLGTLSQIYRTTTPGVTLQESLKDLLQNQQLTPFAATQIMEIFDKVAFTTLFNKTKNKITIKGTISHYRSCENVWHFCIKDAEIADFSSVKHAENLKVVAVDSYVLEDPT